ncbi:carboxy terminal-processing peptidase [Massilia scottii]|uniref:carboxy terminal-processing peptidase n=1 Tax=Massilia scottii TaxID=3057166 RepID=UPI002796AF17|nr:carboxy terminal-processing peptidase [Massilia sp. CCM 9029]MDQ1830366.1 carboxy terminal-processing peptidase [Massilia sp. CCM 9029]
MKKHMLMVALAFAATTHAAVPQPVKVGATQLRPVATQTQAAAWAATVFGRHHYKVTPLDDAMSEKIFDRYLKSLDGDRLHFLQSDIDSFDNVRTKLDDAIRTENLTTPFSMYSLYQQRFNERFAYSRELLKGKFDFTVDETLQIDREKATWPKNLDEARDLWRKRVKNDWLRLKLAGKDDKSIRETLDKRYENYVGRMGKVDSEDVFMTFMNAYATSIEPHTNYLGPRSADNFAIAMRLSLDGIGAVLQQREDYTVIREIVVGSPAGMSGKLKVGDRIVGVAQADSPGFTDVLGWRIDDVVQLIRGPKESVVRLNVLPVDAGTDGKTVTVALVRKKINMEEQAAKKTIIEVKEGGVKRRVGVISLPTFYLDFEARRRGDKDFKSATRDVARILGELKKEKVDNVLIDLRNNGGGALGEAVELTGLFIDKGPVVMQRSAEGRVEVESDVQPGLAWDGPMGVLINRGSASASEIFAAAIQDYGRGLVLGEPSFGKGTVQTLVNLDRGNPGEKARYGELKMTIAQFFRINGGTTQLRGVTPDIKMPVTSDPEGFGESSYENALPWVEIKPVPFTPSGNLKQLVAPLQKRHEARIAKDKDFQYLQEDMAELRKLRKDNVISLNEAVRRKERDALEAKAKQREARQVALRAAVTDEPADLADAKDARSKLAPPAKTAKAATTKPNRQDDGLQADERNLASELAAEKAAKDAKDVMLQEAAHILADEIDMLKTDMRMAARLMPYLPAAK